MRVTFFRNDPKCRKLISIPDGETEKEYRPAIKSIISDFEIKRENEENEEWK